MSQQAKKKPAGPKEGKPRGKKKATTRSNSKEDVTTRKKREDPDDKKVAQNSTEGEASCDDESSKELKKDTPVEPPRVNQTVPITSSTSRFPSSLFIVALAVVLGLVSIYVFSPLVTAPVHNQSTSTTQKCQNINEGWVDTLESELNKQFASSTSLDQQLAINTLVALFRREDESTDPSKKSVISLVFSGPQQSVSSMKSIATLISELRIGQSPTELIYPRWNATTVTEALKQCRHAVFVIDVISLGNGKEVDVLGALFDKTLPTVSGGGLNMGGLDAVFILIGSFGQETDRETLKQKVRGNELVEIGMALEAEAREKMKAVYPHRFVHRINKIVPFV